MLCKNFLFSENKNLLPKLSCSFLRNFSESNVNTNSFEDQKIEKLRNEIKNLTLTYVNSYGWTENTLKISANQLGYSHLVTGIFPNGPIDVIHSLMDTWNEKLKAEVDKIKKDCR